MFCNCHLPPDETFSGGDVSRLLTGPTARSTYFVFRLTSYGKNSCRPAVWSVCTCGRFRFASLTVYSASLAGHIRESAGTVSLADGTSSGVRVGHCDWRATAYVRNSVLLNAAIFLQLCTTACEHFTPHSSLGLVHPIDLAANLEPFRGPRL